MKMFKIPTNISRTLSKTGFKIKKHSPEILVAVGTVGVVVSTVMACKATLKVDAVMDDTKKKVNKIHVAVENGVTEIGETYDIQDSKKDLTSVYAHTGVQLAKLYGPAVLIGAASITCMLTSHNILRKRNLALAAAYATVDQGFKEYRGRVIERFGKDLDRELKYNIKAEEIEEKVVNEDGSETVVKKTVEVAEFNPYSTYAKVFDESCAGWEKDAEMNMFFLHRQQDWANEKLKSRGYLFLNEVYEMLGFMPTRAGQSVGWIYDEKHPIGDNFVDFGIFDVERERVRAFINGYERSIILDFNVDGDIASLMP